MASKISTKTVRRLEKPRPLKFNFQETSNPKDQLLEAAANPCDNIVLELESIVKLINKNNYDHNLASIIAKVCQELKSYGSKLEAQNIDQLDRYFKTLRDAAREDNIEPMCRLKLLEIIELRAMGWRPSDNQANHYRSRLIEAEANEQQHQQQQQLVTSSPTPSIIPSSSSVFTPVANHGLVPLTQSASCSSLVSSLGPSALAPGEVLKSSGKYPKPTKVAAKNYFKDEIIIRNSDSGKVAQGAKDRPVQITGAQEESIQKAKQLIEGTIRRNASPIRSNENTPDDSGGVRGVGTLMHSLSMNDASISEYHYTITVGKDVLKLSGARLDLTRTARLVLEEYFAGDAERTVCDEENHGFPEVALEVDEEDAVVEDEREVVERKAPPWTTRNGHVGSGRIPLHRLSCEVDYSSDTDSSASEDDEDEEEELEQGHPKGMVSNVASVFGVQLVKTGFNGGRSPSRQPLRTSASLDSFHKSEAFLVGSWNQHQAVGPSRETQPKVKTLFYTREELLDLSLSPRSRQNPFIGCTTIQNELEAIRMGGCMNYFDPVAYKRTYTARNLSSSVNYRRGSLEFQEKDCIEEASAN